MTIGKRGGLALIISPDVKFTKLKRHFVGDVNKSHERDNLTSENVELPSILNSEQSILNEDSDVHAAIHAEGPGDATQVQHSNNNNNITSKPTDNPGNEGRQTEGEDHTNNNEQDKKGKNQKKKKRRKKPPPHRIITGHNNRTRERTQSNRGIYKPCH